MPQSFFGYDCLICKELTRAMNNLRQPVCKSCQEAAVEQAKHPPQVCPVDGTSLSSLELTKRSPFLIHQCPTCKGVWMNGYDFLSLQAYIDKKGGNSYFFIGGGDGGGGGE